MLHLGPLMCWTESEKTEMKSCIMSCWNIIIKITFTETHHHFPWLAQLWPYSCIHCSFFDILLISFACIPRWRNTMILHTKPTSQSKHNSSGNSSYITWSFYGSYARCLYWYVYLGSSKTPGRSDKETLLRCHDDIMGRWSRFDLWTLLFLIIQSLVPTPALCKCNIKTVEGPNEDITFL